MFRTCLSAALIVAAMLTNQASCGGINAVLDFVPGADQISGHLTFTAYNTGVYISGYIKGLSPGYHGFHVHEKSDLSDGCRAAGGHFNPFMNTHGAPTDQNRHVGDLGNIFADEYGLAQIDLLDPVISLDPYSPAYIGGRAMVVHQGVDDLGRGGNPDSLKTGNAGGRAGCGIIRD